MQVCILKLAVKEHIFVDLVTYWLECRWIKTDQASLVSAAKEALLHGKERYPRHHFVLKALGPINFTAMVHRQLQIFHGV